MNFTETLAYLKEKISTKPTVGMVLGSGLGALGEEIENPVYLPYGDIPNFVSSTAPGHEGRFVLGEFEGKQVICMQGRLHFYEGYSLEQTTFPIRCMKLLGVETLLLTNAAGGLNPKFKAGDFMMLTDHINFMGTNPLLGANDPMFGVRFCDMSHTYDLKLQDLCRTVAKDLGIALQEGVYLATTGPSYETPAEIRMFQKWGADAVGMSTVPEAIVANHCGMKIVAISCISNLGAGLQSTPLREQEVIDTAKTKEPEFKALVRALVAGI